MVEVGLLQERAFTLEPQGLPCPAATTLCSEVDSWWGGLRGRRPPFPRYRQGCGNMHLGQGTCGPCCNGDVERTPAETHWAPHTRWDQGHPGQSGSEGVVPGLVRKANSRPISSPKVAFLLSLPILAWDGSEVAEKLTHTAPSGSLCRKLRTLWGQPF